MGLVTLTAHVANTILTAAALNNNFNAIVNQVNGSIEAVNLASLAVTTAKINTAAVTYVKLDTQIVQGATTVTAATNDFVAIADTSDSGNYKKALVSDLQTTAASQAEMEAATEAAKYVAPSTTKFHPGVAKAWGRFDGTGTPAYSSGGSYNMDASITDNGTGDYTVSFTTDFSSATAYALMGISRRAAGTASRLLCFDASVDPAAATCRILSMDGGSTPADSSIITFAAFGDQ